MPYDPVIPLQGIYLDKTIIQKDICTPLFIAAILKEIWKQPRCPWTEERDVIYTHDGILLSHKNKMLFAATSYGPKDYHIK